MPPVLALVLALTTKNIILALFCGILSSSIIINGWGFITPIMDDYMLNGIIGNASIFLYMFLFGAFLAAIKRAGGFSAFSNFATAKLNTAKKSKFLTWLLSGIVCNQTFGTVGVGAIMRPITDKHKVSREKLGFLLSSTAEPVCALVPITIYILFFGGMAASVLPGIDGNQLYIQSIPYNLFCILCIVAALLSALEILPDIGYMRKCEKRAKETGAVIREGSNPMTTAELDEMQVPEGVRPDILCFLLPFLAFIGTILIIFFQTGALNLGPSVLIGFAVSVAYPIAKGYFKFEEVPGLIYQGAKSMVPVCVILSLAFGFGKAVEAVGFANFIVSATEGLLTAKLLPAVVFLICCVGSYATGSLVSACVILTPIAIPLAVSLGANLPLVMGALVGGSTFGDCSSPLSDIVIESSMGAGVDVVDLGKAQMLSRVILAALVTVIYLVIA